MHRQSYTVRDELQLVILIDNDEEKPEKHAYKSSDWSRKDIVYASEVESTKSSRS